MKSFSSVKLVCLCLCGAHFGVAIGIDLVDNSRCLPEGSICESSAECCSGELSTLCSHGRCRCWSGMRWNTAMRRCVPSFTFRFGSLDLDIEDEDDLLWNRNHESSPNYDGGERGVDNRQFERTNVNNGDIRVEKPRDGYDAYRPPPPPPPNFEPQWVPEKPIDGPSSFQNVVASDDKLDVQDGPGTSGSQRVSVAFSVASCLMLGWLFAT